MHQVFGARVNHNCSSGTRTKAKRFIASNKMSRLEERQACQSIWSTLFAECEKTIQLYLQSVDHGASSPRDLTRAEVQMTSCKSVPLDRGVNTGTSDVAQEACEKGVNSGECAREGASGKHVLSASSTCATTSMDDLQNEKQPPWPASLGGKQVSAQHITVTPAVPPAKEPERSKSLGRKDSSKSCADVETSDSDSSTGDELPLAAAATSRVQSVSLIKPHHRYLDIVPSPSVSETSNSSIRSNSPPSPSRVKSATKKEMSGHFEATSWIGLKKQLARSASQAVVSTPPSKATPITVQPPKSTSNSVSNVLLSNRVNPKVRLRGKNVQSEEKASKTKKQLVDSHIDNSLTPSAGNLKRNWPAEKTNGGFDGGQVKSTCDAPAKAEAADQRETSNPEKGKRETSGCERVNYESAVAVESIAKPMTTVAPINLSLKSPKEGECNRSSDVITVANLLMTLQQSSCTIRRKEAGEDRDQHAVEASTNRVTNSLTAVVEDEIDSAVASIIVNEGHSLGERSPDTPALAIDDSLEVTAALTTADIPSSPVATCEEEAPSKGPASRPDNSDFLATEGSKDMGKQPFSVANMSPITPVSSPEQVSDCTMSQVMADTSNGDTEVIIKPATEENVSASVTSNVVGETLVGEIVVNSSASTTAQLSLTTNDSSSTKATLQVLDTVAKAMAIAIDGSDDDDDDDLIKVSNAANIVKTGDGQYILYEDLHYQLMASTAITPGYDQNQPVQQQQHQQQQYQPQQQQQQQQQQLTLSSFQGSTGTVTAVSETDDAASKLTYRCTVPGCNLNRLAAGRSAALEDPPPGYSYARGGAIVQSGSQVRSLASTNPEYSGSDVSKFRGQGMLLPRQAHKYPHPQVNSSQGGSLVQASRTSDKALSRNIHSIGPLDMLMQQVSGQAQSKRYPPVMFTMTEAFNEQRSSVARTTYYNRSYHDRSQIESRSQYLARSGEVSINESMYIQRPVEELALTQPANASKSYSHQSYSQIKMASGQSGQVYPGYNRPAMADPHWPVTPSSKPALHPATTANSNCNTSQSTRQGAVYSSNQCQSSPLMSMYARSYPQTPQAPTAMAGGSNYHQNLHQQTQAPASINLQTGKVNHHQQPPHSQNMYCYPSMPHGTSTSDSRYICNDKYCRYTQGYSGCVHNPHQSIHDSTSSSSPYNVSTLNARTALATGHSGVPDHFYQQGQTQTKVSSTGQNQMSRQPPSTQANNAHATPVPFTMTQNSFTNQATFATTPHSSAVQVIQSGQGYRHTSTAGTACQPRSGQSLTSGELGPFYSHSGDKVHYTQLTGSSPAASSAAVARPHSNQSFELQNKLHSQSQVQCKPGLGKVLSSKSLSQQGDPSRTAPSEGHAQVNFTKEIIILDGKPSDQCQCSTGSQCTLHPQAAKSTDQQPKIQANVFAPSSDLNESKKPAMMDIGAATVGDGPLKRKYNLDADPCITNGVNTCASSKSEVTVPTEKATATVAATTTTTASESAVVDSNDVLESSDPFACLKDPFDQSSPLIALAIACASQVDETSLKQIDCDTGKALEHTDLNNNSLGPTPTKMARVDY